MTRNCIRFAGLSMLAAMALMPTAPAFAAKHPAPQEIAAPSSTRALYLSLIRQARLEGHARAALAYLDDFDRQNPEDHEAAVLRVNCLLDLGQLAAAQSALARLPGGDRDGDALAVRGHVFAAQGHWEQAAGQYAAAHAVSPADASIGNALGYAQLRIGQTAQAVETLRGAFDLAAGDPMVRNNLALALTISGHGAEAALLLARIPDPIERVRLSAGLQAEAARIASLRDNGPAAKPQ